MAGAKRLAALSVKWICCKRKIKNSDKTESSIAVLFGGEGGITPLSLRGVRAMRIMLSVLPKLCARLSEPMTPSWFLPALRRYKNEPPQKGRPVFLWRDSSKLKRIIYDKLIFIYVVDIPALSQSILLYALLYLIEFRYFPHRRLNAS